MNKISIPSHKPIVVVPAPEPSNSGKKDYEEKRAAPRFPFTASALVFDVRTQTRIVGRSGDLGSGGCYIDTISPFPVGTAVRVCVDRGSNKFEALATVTYAPASMGMGLAFTEIQPEHQLTLKKWIAELNGDPLPEAPVAEPAPGASALAEVGHMRQVLKQLVTMMIDRKVIDGKEGAELLRQMIH